MNFLQELFYIVHHELLLKKLFLVRACLLSIILMTDYALCETYTVHVVKFIACLPEILISKFTVCLGAWQLTDLRKTRVKTVLVRVIRIRATKHTADNFWSKIQQDPGTNPASVSRDKTCSHEVQQTAGWLVHNSPNCHYIVINASLLRARCCDIINQDPSLPLPDDLASSIHIITFVQSNLMWCRSNFGWLVSSDYVGQAVVADKNFSGKAPLTPQSSLSTVFI